MRVLLLATLAPACAIPEKVAEPDLSCVGAPTPETAAPRVTISGRVTDIAGSPLGADVSIQGFAGDLPLPPVMTDASGRFSYSHDTGGVPTLDFIQASAVGPFLQTITYPSVPIARDEQVDVRMVSEADAMSFTMNAEIPIDFSLGLALLRVTDCTETPVPEGEVTSSPGGDIYYFRFAMPDPAADKTDPSGIVMVANIPVGEAVLSGTAFGAPLRPVTIESRAGANFVLTQLRP
jgi:hypothetical protein